LAFIKAANVFSLGTSVYHRQQLSYTRLLAEAGAPRYDKLQASLREAQVLGKGSVMLHIDKYNKIDYEPGHVLALEIQGNDDLQDSKSSKDAKENDGWTRGPYTVSRATDNSFDILIKVVGEKSKRLVKADPGTRLQFGGKFKVPILQGISTETTKRIVLISTGVGVGPCVGAIEQALQNKNYPPIALIASYRTEEEVLHKEHLNQLHKENPELFDWKAIISSEHGRLSASKENLACLAIDATSIDDTHYHLIGNGQMVQEFQLGLRDANVPDEKVTTEMYFNHKAKADLENVERIAAVLKVAVATASIV
jgi:ferredoxin-NADP reductase